MDKVACLHIKITLDSSFFFQRENKLILELDPLFANSIDSRCYVSLSYFFLLSRIVYLCGSTCINTRYRCSWARARVPSVLEN